MRILTIISVAFLIVSFIPSADAKKNTGAIYKQLAEIQQDYGIPAMSVGIIANGKLVFAEGFGYRDVKGEIPVTKSTRFRIASISKLFTAQAIMQLVEEDRLDLEDPISLYLTGFGTSDITIEQLMSHSSGIKDQVRPIFGRARRLPEYLEDVIQSLETLESRKTFNYSDTGFNLLGAIISSVSGKSYEDYILANILQPANMVNSGYFDGAEGVKPEALATYKGEAIASNQQRPYDPSFYPSEGLISNVSDLSNWLILTLSHNEKLLNDDTYKEMLQPRVKTTWGNISIGLGWQVYKENDQVVARHPGSIRGYSSLIIFYPKTKNAIVLLTNASEVPRLEIANRIANKLIDLEVWR